MSQFYNQYGEIFYINTINIKMEDLYEPFLKLLPENGRILDAGCGSGRDAFAFKNLGYQVEAMDAAEKMVFLSSHLLEQKVHHMTFQEMAFDEPFEGVWACASLLHVPSEDMQKVLTNLNKVLKPGGVLYATFKYGTFEGERHERFFNDYDEEKFATLDCKSYGFETIKLWKAPDLREEHENEWWLNVLLMKQK